jgi:hypothetical protein
MRTPPAAAAFHMRAGKSLVLEIGELQLFAAGGRRGGSARVARSGLAASSSYTLPRRPFSHAAWNRRRLIRLYDSDPRNSQDDYMFVKLEVQTS